MAQSPPKADPGGRDGTPDRSIGLFAMVVLVLLAIAFGVYFLL